MKKYLFLCMIILLLGVLGCSQSTTANLSNPENTVQDGSEAKPFSIRDFAGREISFTHVPDHIIALGNGEMDIIYALGGELVGRPNALGSIAVQAAEDVLQVGSSHEIDLEKIAYLEADVVLGNYPLNMKDIPTIESLGANMILSTANSIDDIKQQIQLFGQLLQKEAKAQELVANINEQLEEINARQGTVKPRVLLVYGAPGTNMAALPNSLSGHILELAGGTNIAADYPSLQAFPQYAQLNTERVMEANPQVILIMSHGNPEQVKASFINEMQQNAAWNNLDAVLNNQVEVLPSDLFGTNPGTRIIEAVELMYKLLHLEK